MAVVVMTIVQIRKCVLKLAGEAKVKIPDFPKETQNVENHCVSEKFEINGEKCEANGIAYYYYPVHKGKESIANMLKEFTTFCELIDGGDFFISCAQGLHRTDIALCTYWVFYGADRGKEPPVLVGYLKEKGHDAGKIFHVLNSFYDLYTEQNGVEPMSIELFKERKNMINRISKGENANET